MADFSRKTLALRTGRGETDVEIFVAVLGHANPIYAEAMPDQTVRHWTMAHRRALEYFGAECEIVLEEWERLIPELRGGSFDVIAASISITEKRRQLVSFTDRYYSNVVRFVARKGSGFDPADAAGKTIGAARATIAADWLQANLSDATTIKLYTEQQALYGDLVVGRLDAMFGDGLGSYAWLQGPEGAGFAFVGEGYRLDEGIGMAVRHEDASLLSRLNGALEAILANGTYEQINARYFPFSIY